jgi:hypothetical protein
LADVIAACHITGCAILLVTWPEGGVPTVQSQTAAGQTAKVPKAVTAV